MTRDHAVPPPVVAWHGSPAPIDRFDPGRVTNTGGFWFGADPDGVRPFGRPHPYLLRMERPGAMQHLGWARARAASEGFDAQTDPATTNLRVIALLRDRGFDSIATSHHGGCGGQTVFVVFSPDQIEALPSPTHADTSVCSACWERSTHHIPTP